MRLCRRPTRLDLRLGDAAEQRPTGLTSPRRGSGVGGVSPPAPASCAEGGPGGRHSTWAASIPPCFGPGSAQAVVGIDLVSRTQPVRRQHHRGEIRGQKALAWSCLSVLKNPWYRPRPFTRSLGRAWPLTLVPDRMALAPPLLPSRPAAGGSVFRRRRHWLSPRDVPDREGDRLRAPSVSERTGVLVNGPRRHARGRLSRSTSLGLIGAAEESVRRADYSRGPRGYRFGPGRGPRLGCEAGRHIGLHTCPGSDAATPPAV
jgi:hypothetical protein